MTNALQMSQAYANIQIQTSTNPANICMLHEKCIFFLKSALRNNQEIHCTQINKVQNILVELEHALIIEDNLSKSLFYIYDYCYAQLEKSDIKSYQNVLSILSILYSTFKELLESHQ